MTPAPEVFGFLTVISSEELGLVGGYLILNESARPLEFHCTVPVKPNRAQQILFGPTLEPYLYGEQIGQTLLSKGSIEPVAVYTDSVPVLSVREFIKLPVALVCPAPPDVAGDACATVDGPAEPLPTGTTWRLDSRHNGPRLVNFTLGRNRLAVTESHRGDQQALVCRLGTLENFDLSEPFERIREAIEEAHKQSRT